LSASSRRWRRRRLERVLPRPSRRARTTTDTVVHLLLFVVHRKRGNDARRRSRLSPLNQRVVFPRGASPLSSITPASARRRRRTRTIPTGLSSNTRRRRRHHGRRRHGRPTSLSEVHLERNEKCARVFGATSCCCDALGSSKLCSRNARRRAPRRRRGLDIERVSPVAVAAAAAGAAVTVQQSASDSPCDEGLRMRTCARSVR
jgi:hypothetical protein